LTCDRDKANQAKRQGERPKNPIKESKQPWQRYGIGQTIKMVQTIKKTGKKTDRWTGKT
jgi:hypothetical protein